MTGKRFETGDRKLADVTVLRRFADVLGLPPEAFGLTPGRVRPASPHPPIHGSRVSRKPITGEVDESVRRRAFLLAAGLAGTGLRELAARTHVLA